MKAFLLSVVCVLGTFSVNTSWAKSSDESSKASVDYASDIDRLNNESEDIAKTLGQMRIAQRGPALENDEFTVTLKSAKK